ncbi:dTDP-4-dehydrorhamnose reductase [Solitalea koreensis]|uniref:dTDP-4-dehydrorhamnose reductase n=1 Tax=Solitalea koreensis TaxID=543615 RepID=A0A521CRE5_9SPHI|nr:dTDP-4-dehydrorhamnose reductase [Solitalea koreensis]SMO61240.1 dTDP-4-dehydrorhamnose reductase [Solitalea koreensis]
MNILVTGANGQLGNELRLLDQTSTHNFIFTDVAELDICNAEHVNRFFETNAINACINCAAYTAVDKAETDQELAYAINVIGPENLAKACAIHNAVMLQVSTDFVFDGNASVPYTEDIPVTPLSIYGQTKADAEQLVLALNPKTFVLRTAWLYSSFGGNFVKTMLRLGAERSELGVIFDQVGTPTYARDLANAILVMIEKENSEYGIYHYSNEGVASWFDFAKAIFELGNLSPKVKPLRTENYPTPAKRPHFSVMDKQKIRKEFGLEIPYWRESLKECLSLLVEGEIKN